LRKQDRSAAIDESRIADLEQRVDQLRSELDGQRRRALAEKLLDDLTSALVGELDPERVVRALERWVTGSVRRSCSITRRPPATEGGGVGPIRRCAFPSAAMTGRWGGSASTVRTSNPTTSRSWTKRRTGVGVRWPRR
jgi:hypothetical protein